MTTPRSFRRDDEKGSRMFLFPTVMGVVKSYSECLQNGGKLTGIVIKNGRVPMVGAL